MKNKCFVILFSLSIILFLSGCARKTGNIYSDDYPNNYDVLFDSRLANRFYNEIKKDLELELESENFKAERLIGTNYEIEFSNIKENKFYETELYLTNTLVSFSAAGYSNDLNQENFDKYFESLAYTLAPEISNDEIDKLKNKISDFEFNTNKDSFNIELSHGVTLYIGQIEDVENEFYIFANRTFSDSELLDDSLMYSELPENMETFYNEYSSISYNDILRDENGRIGEKHTFNGVILDYHVDSNGFSAYAEIANESNLNQVYRVYFSFEDIPEILFIVNDKVSVYGELDGLSKYKTESGDEITIPFLIGHYMNLIED